MDRNPVIRMVPLTEQPLDDIIGPVLEELLPLTHEQLLEIEEMVGIPLGPFTTSTNSLEGYTMDSTLIVNTVSVPVRSLWQGGYLEPVIIEEVEGTGLAAHPVTTYIAEFIDRDREIVITEETYRAMIEGGEPHNEAPTDTGVDRLQTSMEPISGDRASSQEQAVDGHGRTRPYRDDTRFPARTPAP